MASFTNTAEGQPDTTVATTGNTGGSSGDAFGTVSGSPTFSAEAAAAGTRAYKFTGAASAAANLLRWTDTASGTVRAAGWFRVPSLPTASACNVVQFRHSSGNTAVLQIATDGVLKFLDVSAAGATALATITPNTWYWVSMLAGKGTSTSDGTMEVEVRDTGGTVIGSYSSAARNVGTADHAGVQFGRLSTTAAATIYWDGLRYESGAGALIAPPATPPTLVVEQPAANVVDLRDSTSGAGSLTFPTPTRVSGATLTVTELAPGLWLFTQDTTAAVYTVSTTQTDTQSDSDTVTIEPAATATVALEIEQWDGTTWT